MLSHTLNTSPVRWKYAWPRWYDILFIAKKDGSWTSTSHSKSDHWSHQDEREHLERLRSDNTPAAPWLPTLLIHIGSQVETRRCESYNWKNCQKFKFWNFAQIFICDTRLRSLDKMYTYEMDPASVVEDTERTRFHPQTDGRTDRSKGLSGQMHDHSRSRWSYSDRRTNRRTDGQHQTSIHPFQLRCSSG